MNDSLRCSRFIYELRVGISFYWEIYKLQKSVVTLLREIPTLNGKRSLRVDEVGLMQKLKSMTSTRSLAKRFGVDKQNVNEFLGSCQEGLSCGGRRSSREESPRNLHRSVEISQFINNRVIEMKSSLSVPSDR